MRCHPITHEQYFVLALVSAARKYILDCARLFPPELPRKHMVGVLIPVNGLGMRPLSIPLDLWKEELHARFDLHIQSVKIPHLGLTLFYSDFSKLLRLRKDTDRPRARDEDFRPYLNKGDQSQINDRAQMLVVSGSIYSDMMWFE